ncbi:anti-sigma factor antagonist [Pontibacter sp. JH31]|uniref:Anti-sigma factor antagonist n=1 Tax=Pontibacter aquaedesilientis TaxID=2766980 RepID=A0ABR7XDC0_9BACT|nr:STAS domain-containing protein [Pontibacter aquaedesilientis]MBD1395911.1 anti-sigma factor antagonist [Pontibacter aquaedesilientis]
MEITNHTHRNQHATIVQGLVNEQAFAAIRQALSTALPLQDQQLWIDCSHVDRVHLTNSSICSFVSELLQIRKQNVKVVLYGMNATTERLFRLLQLDTLFDKARTLEELQAAAKAQPIAA